MQAGDVNKHAKVMRIEDDQVNEYIFNMQQEEVEDQSQMPNPTLMRYGESEEDICLVFTSDLKFSNSEDDS